MEVILTEDVEKLGKAGDIVKVKDGFCRNYLLPNKKAMIANKGNVKALEAQKKMIEAKLAKSVDNAREFAAKLGGLEITIAKDVGVSDRLFGSVTKMDIVNNLRRQGIQLDKHIMELETPIKNLGEYQIPVKLHREVIATLKVIITRKS